VASREAERRQLTLMFVDLVGSTELAARLDPEDLSRVIRAYQEHCAEVVERWGGHIAKYMGDGCSPISLSGGVRGRRRAGSAGGLAIIDALTSLETPAGEPLAARIGIATGLVMVWELIGEGVAQERGRRDAQSGGSIAGARRAGQCRDQPR
jgi:class 3 adenylate cyclase